MQFAVPCLESSDSARTRTVKTVKDKVCTVKYILGSFVPLLKYRLKCHIIFVTLNGGECHSENILLARSTWSNTVVPKVGGTAPWGAVGLPRWALLGTRGGRGRC
jgi:hypothetical protein